MNIGIKLEQNQKHKISGRKKSNYEKLEREYQEAQSHGFCPVEVRQAG